MDPLELLQQLCLHLVCIFKIYVKYALITLVIYFIAEWYIVRYGAELEAQLDAPMPADERPASNSTLGKAFRFVLNFFII